MKRRYSTWAWEDDGNLEIKDPKVTLNWKKGIKKLMVLGSDSAPGKKYIKPKPEKVSLYVKKDKICCEFYI